MRENGVQTIKELEQFYNWNRKVQSASIFILAYLCLDKARTFISFLKNDNEISGIMLE